MGTLGAGNHYAEIQVIDKVFDDAAARKMGIDQEGQASPWLSRCIQKQTAVNLCTLLQHASIACQLSCHEAPYDGTWHGAWPTEASDPTQVCIMIHSGSRGLGHQVATDALTSMERAMARDGIQTNDRQLACARIGSQARACALLRSLPRTTAPACPHYSLPCIPLPTGKESTCMERLIHTAAC